MLMNHLRSGKFVKWVMIIVVLTFIGTIFFAWGMDIDGGGMGTRSAVIEIDGKQISFKQFNDDLMNRYRSEKEEGDFSSQRMEIMRNELYQQYLAQHILEQTIKELKLSASADELIEYFRSNPPPGLVENEYFKTNGVFDTSKYHQFLDSPEAYNVPGMAMLENYHSSYTIPANQLQLLIGNTPKITDVEARITIRNATEKIAVEWLYFPAVLSEIVQDVSDKEMKEWYDANRDTFKTEGMAELSYIELPKIASEADEESVRREIFSIEERVRAGESFAVIAYETSEDGSAKDSGSLGFFGRGAMVKPFEEVAFLLKEGEVSKPVQTQFGWHLIQCVERDAKTERVNCRHILLKIQPSMQTVDSLKDIADEMAEEMTAGGSSLAELAAKRNMIVSSTGIFNRNEPIPSFNTDGRFVPGLRAFAFNKEKRHDVFESDAAVYLFVSAKRCEGGIAPYDFVSNLVKQKILSKKRMEITLAKASNAYKNVVSSGGKLRQIYLEDSLTVKYGVDSAVTRDRPLPYIGASSKAIYAAFKAADGSVTEPIEAGLGYAILKKLEGVATGTSNIAEPSEIIAQRQRMQQQQQYYVYGSWFEAKKEKLKVKNHIDAFYYQ